MNRIFNNKATTRELRSIDPLHRPARQLRLETEAALLDMAFVLQLTQRIKEEILAEEGVEV
jgi:hypothetical protein